MTAKIYVNGKVVYYVKGMRNETPMELKKRVEASILVTVTIEEN